ncbi:hypothetical protein [Culicoidibacter larvae]|uniref:Uncharacterized protein n=1 Tax=Culicoidibacter larvae TaxID=2579976 RepID=A0A5R8Q6N1_9FIRM|nr:hypothetical protein [Culicoidibacter larvae]TLG71069.1 hypothetical protein FEZ08_11700 [Culicoidibacter larvae]
MKILNTLENLEVIAKHYVGNYIFELKEEDPKYFNKMIKSYMVFETDDNYKFAIRFDYDAIKKTVYYNDETEAPEITENYFIHYNMRYNNYSRVCKQLALLTYHLDESNGVYVKNRSFMHDDSFTVIRELTEDEKCFLINVAEEKDDQYKKRVVAYYKRYNDIIYADGYWANR